jgi:hypothetical protein
MTLFLQRIGVRIGCTVKLNGFCVDLYILPASDRAGKFSGNRYAGAGVICLSNSSGKAGTSATI